MTGEETVTVTVTGPDGQLCALPVALAEGGGHFQATLHWLQLGLHKVAACPLSCPYPAIVNGLRPRLSTFLKCCWLSGEYAAGRCRHCRAAQLGVELNPLQPRQPLQSALAMKPGRGSGQCMRSSGK
jgi:hypothetical protein